MTLLYLRKSILTLIGATALSASVFSQHKDFKLYMKSGAAELPANFQEFLASPSAADHYNDRYYRLVQFYSIPTSTEKKQLEQAGVKLLHYIPSNTYFASISAVTDLSQLAGFKIRSVQPVKNEYKLTAELFAGSFPEWAVPQQGYLDVNVNYYSDINPSLVKSSLAAKNISIVKAYDYSYKLTLRIKQGELMQLASLPFISAIEPIDAPPQPENLPGRTDHRSNAIASDFASGRHYTGEGVKVAMGDDGIIGPHIDYQGRADQTNVIVNNGNHGDHVAGTIMGAGNLDPAAKGMAYGADLYVYQVWDAVELAPSTYLNPGIRLTSTSYSDGCNAGYTSFAQTVDQQSREMPLLLHVFSSGNNGTADCDYGAGAGWGNVTGGVKIGKNVLAVGNVTFNDALAGSSSRGPAHDGRIKPEVCAVGTNVYSTIDEHTYDSFTGTSMACPGTSGTLAQLYQAYREANAGSDPHGGLMKAILMNAADDLGNAGPDFKHGFGRINALRAAKTIEDGRHLTDSIQHGESKMHTINVPAGMSQVRVMIYWTDYEAATNASVALVNNLNMQLIDPSSSAFNPWVLNTAATVTALNSVAARGIDNLNNVEQVTIDAPAPGTYTVTVNGAQIPQGPQTYYIVYELIDDNITVTYPIGGESFTPGVVETLRWDAHGTAGGFAIEYSTDNGATWATAGTAAAGLRYFSWDVPAELTGKAIIKVTRGASSDISDSTFSITRIPTNLRVTWSCPDSVRIDWNAAAGAAAYEVSMLGSRYMDAVGRTSQTFMVVHNIDPLKEHWFSVRAIGADSAVGQRAKAIRKSPGTNACPMPFDAALTTLNSPAAGTLYNCHDLSNLPVTITIRNSGVTSLSNIPVSYNINGSQPAVTETYAGPLAPGATTSYTFTGKANVSAAGLHDIYAWADLGNDGNFYNDSISVTVRVMPGSASSLPWFENFESIVECATTTGCDFQCELGTASTNEKNGLGDNMDWRANQGETPTGSTGPDVDHTLGTAQGTYLYTETSTCYQLTSSYLTSCINLAGETTPQLSFWYHLYGASMGSLHVDVYADGAWTNNVASVSGNQSNVWKQKSVLLTSFAGKTINIRFRGISGSSNTSDMAIDDISVADATVVDEASFGQGLRVYPNPAAGIFNLTLPESAAGLTVTVTDVQGRQISSQIIPAGKGTTSIIDISSYSNGIYLLHITDGSRQHYSRLNKL